MSSSLLDLEPSGTLVFNSMRNFARLIGVLPKQQVHRNNDDMFCRCRRSAIQSNPYVAQQPGAVRSFQDQDHRTKALLRQTELGTG
jgi:hypothetical protein